jgi:hypothetical protein
MYRWLAVAGLLFASVAQAEEPMQGGFYMGEAFITIEAGGRHYHSDVASGLTNAITDFGGTVVLPPDNASDLSDRGFFSAIEGTAPLDLVWFNTDSAVFRLEGDWFRESSNSAFTPGAGQILSAVRINGSPRIYGIANPGETVNSSLDLDYARYSTFLGVGRSLPGDNGHHIAFGLYAAMSQLELASSLLNTADPTEFERLYEDVETFSIGPQIVARNEIELSPTTTLFSRASAALLYARGDLDAQQNWGGVAQRGQFSAHDDQSDVALLLGVQGGLNFKPTGNDNIIFGLVGGVEWRNDAYEIVNPQPGLGSVVGAVTPSPARIEQTELFSATAGIRLTFNFN